MSENHPQITVETPAGWVCYCLDCDRVSLRSGALLLPLSRERFHKFVGFLEETFARHFANPEASEVRVRFSELYLCFQKAEAEALLQLVQQALTEIWRYQLEQSYGLAPVRPGH